METDFQLHMQGAVNFRANTIVGPSSSQTTAVCRIWPSSFHSILPSSAHLPFVLWEKLTEIPSLYLSAWHGTCHGCSRRAGRTAGLLMVFDPTPPKHLTQINHDSGTTAGPRPGCLAKRNPWWGDMGPSMAPACKAMSPWVSGGEAALLRCSCGETLGVKALCVSTCTAETRHAPRFHTFLLSWLFTYTIKSPFIFPFLLCS